MEREFSSTKLTEYNETRVLQLVHFSRLSRYFRQTERTLVMVVEDAGRIQIKNPWTFQNAMEGYRSWLRLQKISVRRPRNKESWQLHVILEEDSLTWSLEEVEYPMDKPKDKLTEEDLDQPVKSAGEEEGDEKEEVQRSNGHANFWSPTPRPPQTGAYITQTLQRTRVSKLFDKWNRPSSLPQQLSSEHFCKEQKLRPAKLSHKIILKVRRE